MHDFFDNPALTFGLAMAFGVLAQGLARHASLPGIVILLGAGVLLGPDVANVVQPDSLGSALPAVVGFSVAVILFEGGLNLHLSVLRRQAKPIRWLVTLGALVTAGGGAVVAHYAMGWDWRMSILFGTLIIVTGPTVVTPLLRRIKVKPTLATILEAEGVFIDAIGATVAVVALEIAIAPSGGALGEGILSIALRLATGAAVGVAGGALLAVLLRWRRVVPRGLENILALSMAVSLFEFSNALVHESGITAAIAAGMILGNVRSHALDEIAEFKEQLTVLLIATLFVLLAANVRVDAVVDLGWRGLLTVAGLVFVVRPLSVFLCTARTPLTLRDKLFLSWVAPRGIVAAAVAALFATELARAGIEGGKALEALVFMVIAITVTLQGLSSGLVASLLGVRQTSNSGYLFLGANPLALYLAGRLQDSGEQVVLMDSNPDECRAAEEAGFRVLYGNGMDSRMLTRARAEQRATCVGVTSNESVNLLFAQRVLAEFHGPVMYVAIETDAVGVTADMVHDIDGRVLFGGARGLNPWIARYRRGEVVTRRCRYEADESGDPAPFASAPTADLLPLLRERDGELALVHDLLRLRRGDIIEFALNGARMERADQWLAEAGWLAEPEPEVEASSSAG